MSAELRALEPFSKLERDLIERHPREPGYAAELVRRHRFNSRAHLNADQLDSEKMIRQERKARRTPSDPFRERYRE